MYTWNNLFFLKDSCNFRTCSHSHNIWALPDCTTSLVLLLRVVGRKGSGPGEGLHAAPGLGLTCAITRVLPRLRAAMRTVEDRRWGKAYCVCSVSRGSEALWLYCTVGALAIL